MAAVPYLPSRDADLQTWAVAFSGLITATPTVYGLIAGQATTLAGLVSAYTSALALATGAATRTSVTVAAKDTAKANLVFLIQSYVAIIQGYPAITPALLSGLGLTVRSTTRTPINPPTTFPLISILSIISLNARLTISDELTPDAKKRPFGAAGMELYIKVAGPAPIDLSSMTYVGVFTRTPTDFVVPNAALGETVFMRGVWINDKGERGPMGPLVSATAG